MVNQGTALSMVAREDVRNFFDEYITYLNAQINSMGNALITGFSQVTNI